MELLRNRLFYFFKPLIPRNMQIVLRRKIFRIKRDKYTNVWPIDNNSVNPPDGWRGWPDNKQFALVLIHDVDTAKGQDNCRNLLSIEEDLGFVSSFNIVPERYKILIDVREYIASKGHEVGVHGLKHDGKLYSSLQNFRESAVKINNYLQEWNSVGFCSPSMHCNLEWNHYLNIKYDISTFDTDPFEPHSEARVGTIFPFTVKNGTSQGGYVELPYTLPQDFTLFVIMEENSIGIWKKKLDWIVENGGMALLNTHPDYMNFNGGRPGLEEYPAEYYREFLEYVKKKYNGRYWNVLPKELAAFWQESALIKQ